MPARSRPVRIRPKRQYAHKLIAPPPAPTWRDRFPVHRLVGVVLLVLSVTLVITHQAEHAGAIRLMPQAWEDLLIGFPTAGVAAIAGFVALIWR